MAMTELTHCIVRVARRMGRERVGFRTAIFVSCINGVYWLELIEVC